MAEAQVSAIFFFVIKNSLILLNPWKIQKLPDLPLRSFMCKNVIFMLTSLHMHIYNFQYRCVEALECLKSKLLKAFASSIE